MTGIGRIRLSPFREREAIVPVLNHHVVSAADSEASACFYSDVLGLEQRVGRRPRGVLRHPDGHRLEIITRAYGSGGTEGQHVHPLVAPTIEPSSRPAYF